MNRDDTANGSTARRSSSPHGGFRWSTVLWALVAPERRQRVVPTLSGVLLVALALGIGTAAYNASNNILFITLSLLLACLVLSGILSWLNFRGVSWRLRLAGPFRAGHDATVGVTLASAKRILSTHALWFDLAVRTVEHGAPARAETTFIGRGLDVKAALARADAAEARTRLFLDTRLDPAGERSLEWTFRPAHRGRMRVELEGVGSLFPFGFLQKRIVARAAEEIVVWPAAVNYRRLPVNPARRRQGDERLARIGAGSDLQALRRYESGDSHRLIHWKASARTGQLLVRQFAAEGAERYSLWLRTDASTWPHEPQFERAVGLAATLAEDLFRADRLLSVALDAEPPAPVRRIRDVETWLDRLAVAARVTMLPRPNAAERTTGGGAGDVITFAPDGPRDVAALIHGEKIATA